MKLTTVMHVSVDEINLLIVPVVVGQGTRPISPTPARTSRSRWSNREPSRTA